LNKSSLPPLLGFRLGMSREELAKRFAGLKLKTASMPNSSFRNQRHSPKTRTFSAVGEVGHVAINVSRFPEFAEIEIVALRLEQGAFLRLN
jgi:hypothetical protein